VNGAEWCFEAENEVKTLFAVVAAFRTVSGRDVVATVIKLMTKANRAFFAILEHVVVNIFGIEEKIIPTRFPYI
jgi:hypothetical protein